MKRASAPSRPTQRRAARNVFARTPTTKKSSPHAVQPPAAVEEGDICIIVEGGYPYTLGGVATWLDSFLKSFPQHRFHVVALCTSMTKRVAKYKKPANVIAITDVDLDRCPMGRKPTNADRKAILSFCAHVERLLGDPDAADFAELVLELASHDLGQDALLDSRTAWQGMEQAYEKLAPGGPLVDFFWTWRNFAICLIALARAPLPPAKIYHALSTGYSGILGARARITRNRPFIITEHGIYTNERRIEIAIAEWLYASGAGGFDTTGTSRELHDLWLDAFRNFSAMAYAFSDAITTQYRDNQAFQRNDGAEAAKQHLIPNGIDVSNLVTIAPAKTSDRPTIALLGRVVPIKDTRTFILAAGELRKQVPDVQALIIGPEDEDPAYAADCHALVEHENLKETVTFVGRVPELHAYFSQIDVLVMTSISEAQPLVLLEAGAAGLPAVTSDVGSCREIIEGLPEDGVEGHGGIVVPACDPKATADALEIILKNDAMRRDMAIAMRNRVVSYYNRTRVDGLYEGLYEPFFAVSRD